MASQGKDEGRHNHALRCRRCTGNCWCHQRRAATRALITEIHSCFSSTQFALQDHNPSVANTLQAQRELSRLAMKVSLKFLDAASAKRERYGDNFAVFTVGVLCPCLPC